MFNLEQRHLGGRRKEVFKGLKSCYVEGIGLILIFCSDQRVEVPGLRSSVQEKEEHPNSGC